MRTTTVLSLAAIFVAGCGVGQMECEKGKGGTVTREIPVAMLNAIVVEGSMDVNVLRGDTQRVEVTAQPGLIDLVKTKVDNGVWRVGTTKCFSSDEEFSIRLMVPMLNSVIVEGSGDVLSERVFNSGKTHLEVRGSGSITVDTLHERLLEIRIGGSGGIVINAGECQELDARSHGSGDVRAGGLCVRTVNADLSGSGGLLVDVLDTLTADLSGSGDLRYRGGPVIIPNSIGSGKLIAMP